MYTYQEQKENFFDFYFHKTKLCLLRHNFIQFVFECKIKIEIWKVKSQCTLHLESHTRMIVISGYRFSSVACVGTVCIETFSAALPHGVHQDMQHTIWDRIPLLMQELGQLGDVNWSGVVSGYSSTQLIPEMLNWCQIRRASWPLHSGDAMLLQVVVHDTCTVRSGVVILKHRAGAQAQKSWLNQGTHNLVAIALSGQRPPDDVKGCPVLPAEASPDHDRATTIAIHFSYSIVSIALSWPSPHANSAVVKGQSKARLISKEYLGPLLSVPPHVTTTPGCPRLAMTLSEGNSHHWPT